MRFFSNGVLKICLSILLLLCLFDLSYDQFEITRFILIASFAWLAISENEPSKKGWRFLFGVFVVLFNPFFKLEITKDYWELVDIIVSVLLIINILNKKYDTTKIKDKLRKYWIKLFSRKTFIFLVKLGVVIAVCFIIEIAYHEYQKVQLEKKEKKRKIVQDSLAKIAHHNDSINEIKMVREQAKEDSSKQIEKTKMCTEKNAITNFKNYMSFYYPTWKIQNDPKISSDGDCSFEISALVKSTKYGGVGDAETLVVEINFWAQDYYKKFGFHVIKSPILFDQ
jgi:hypothetical protein